MVKIKKQYILLTCFTSGMAAILSLASLGTEQWIVADGRYADENIDEIANIKYGLFGGVLYQKLTTVSTFSISMTCNYKENACAVLCKNSAEERQDELKKLLNGENVKFDSTCPHIQKSWNGRSLYSAPQKRNSVGDRTFINSGVYMSTLISLLFSTVFGLLATILSVWNTGGNPIHAYLNILGLYIYNAVAAFFSLLVLCIWGTEYSLKLLDNIAILYTIVGEMATTGQAVLGFSYWLNIGSLFLYGLSIFLLWYRQYTIEREPEVKMDVEDFDENIILY